MNYAVVNNGVVTNIIIAPENYVYPFEGEAILSNEAQIGWIYEDGKFFSPVFDEENASLLSIESREEDSAV